MSAWRGVAETVGAGMVATARLALPLARWRGNGEG
ncbi:hypothetical protein EV129_11391 [Rhizobium azibense]|uniref:Uncharacterized protein n=1 Tax=Rhizobium azibense TaxID=1136135 RepID=A0A4R3REY7_9HYPH|nr:hypothetical protein EV129_11391 [Rhizobium azibense]